MATAFAVAFVVFSCGGKKQEIPKIDYSVTPIQVVDSMYFVTTENGLLKMRVEGGQMERYEADTVKFELFPNGIHVFSYNDQGQLESTIVADFARHDSPKNGSELWKAYGNVVIRNIINQQTMETDTLYWDRDNERIYTDCYVRMYSPDGFMQGYGMESDQRASMSVILKPFNSYGIVERDSTEVLVDSVNFIGPILKK